MPVTGGRGFRGLKPLWYNGVRLYAFCNAFGILTGDEDTDAGPETAEYSNQPVVHAGNQQRNGHGHITLKQAWLIKGLLKEKGFTKTT